VDLLVEALGMGLDVDVDAHTVDAAAAAVTALRTVNSMTVAAADTTVAVVTEDVDVVDGATTGHPTEAVGSAAEVADSIEAHLRISGAVTEEGEDMVDMEAEDSMKSAAAAADTTVVAVTEGADAEDSIIAAADVADSTIVAAAVTGMEVDAMAAVVTGMEVDEMADVGRNRSYRAVQVSKNWRFSMLPSR